MADSGKSDVAERRGADWNFDALLRPLAPPPPQANSQSWRAAGGGQPPGSQITLVDMDTSAADEKREAIANFGPKIAGSFLKIRPRGPKIGPVIRRIR